MSESSAQLEYLQRGTAPPAGRIARWWIDPVPWWQWCAVLIGPTLVLQFLMARGPLDADAYYMVPVRGAVMTIPLAVVFAAARAGTRPIMAARHGVNDKDLMPDSRGAAVALVIAAGLVVLNPAPLRLAVAVRAGGLEALRARVVAGTVPAGPVTVLPLTFTDTEAWPHGTVILYTSGVRGDFPGSGAGLLYSPRGAPLPPYNEGTDGRLLGNWHWFTTD